MSIPIVNAERNIVGWTDVAPAVVRNRLRHRDAERLLGGPIFCVEIMVSDRRQLARAGAPSGWRSSWRCLALCSDERIGSLDQIKRFLASPGVPHAKTLEPRPPWERARTSRSGG